jgi:hypothetical protein
VHTFLGLIGVVAFIVCIVSLAAAITWLVVRFTPSSNGDDAAKSPSRSS